MDRLLTLLVILSPFTGLWSDTTGTKSRVDCPTSQEFIERNKDNLPIKVPEGCRVYGSMVAYDRVDWLRLKKRLDLAEAWRGHDAKELRRRNRELIDCKNKIELDYTECSSAIHELADSMRCPPPPPCPTCSDWTNRALGFSSGVLLCGGALIGGRF